MIDKSFTIKELSKISGYSTNTIRRYVKGNRINAQMINGVYQITQAEAERFFKVGKGSGNVQDINKDIPISNDLMIELRDRIHQLESDKSFLQKQILDLQDTIRMLTIRKLPKYPSEDTRGIFTKVREFFVGKKD